ncbi:EF hand domain-containing protein [Pyricularia oryzae Y34]|uniref:EF hand domain-containing protein n=2 Tax=Pyricularia oryzae TaxID=318829 RepID=A0AA97NYE4_PYRO3|nr:EF hand domain-containing protein [Pyricularia oryzae Y34]
MAESGAEADEKRYYGQLFRQADTDGVGVVTGDVAVKFFDKTRLESRILGEIWQIADQENRGFLTPAGFGIVLRLIGHAQAGREPTPEVALQPGPLPRFDGINIPGLAPQTSGSGPGPAAMPLQAQGTGVRIPPLTPEKAAQYAGLFEQQNLAPGNMLPGDQARQIFERSGLPTEVLGRIWQLADTEQRGALVQTEFIIAMHLLASTKQGQLRGLPNVVSAGLYEAATRRPTGIPGQRSPTSGVPPIPAIPRQLSGQSQMRTGSPLGRSQTGPGSDWLITAADKGRFDQEYVKLDAGNKGFITGEEAVPFFSQSNLPEDTLAQIWDLADINSAGRLTRDEFAIAMYLIRQQRTNRNGANTLPATLPPNLIPPSMRGQARPPTANAAHSAFDAPAPPPPLPPAQPKSALDDLFGLDTPPVPAAPLQKPIATGGSNDPFGSNASPASASPAKQSPTVPTFAPFVPSSSFGRTLTAQTTGASNSSAGAFPKPAPVQQPQHSGTFDDDLLGDNDEGSKNVSNDSAELANLSNQISSLSKHMQEVQGQRTTTQNELNQSAAQKKNFEQRLAQLRALYEKEAKDVRALEDQLNASRSETKKLQTEMAMLEGTYQDLQNQHRQVATALQADQQENANLKDRIRAVNAEVAQLKPLIEKLKLEARQQKGLVAINKKQLATNESERDKLKSEMDDFSKGTGELSRQNTGAAAQVASPAVSTTSVNNPFFRRTGSTDIMGAFASPPAKPSSNDKSFDDVFGPSFGSASNTPPPTTAFLAAQNTGASTGSAASFATPATSNTPNLSRQPTLTTGEPPAPPESRQMNSSFLPFGETESLSSSRQVSPPASRMGQADLPPSDSVQKQPTAPLQSTNTGLSAASGSHGDVPGTTSPTPRAVTHSHSDSVGDPFSSVDQAKAKDDFESAFASFKNAHTKPAAAGASAFDMPSSSTGGSEGKEPTVAAFASEFPPISELERDDDSDSESDRDGFDDDFAPTSPKPATETNTIGVASSEDIKPTSPSTAHSGADGASSNVATTPAAATSSSSVNTAMPPTSGNAASVAAPTATGSLGSAGPSGPPPTAPPPLPEKKSFDDLDDDFEGLEDAQEGSAADEDFANISRSALDDFNPVFDDSSPPRSHGTKSDLSKDPTIGTGAPNLGAETSSFDFVSGSSASLGSSSAQPASTGPPAPAKVPAPGAAAEGSTGNDNHDWDALFADLDGPAAGNTGTVAPAATENSTSAKSPTAAPSRPAEVSRLMTEEGVHDDPILKNLTSMGYSRKDAVAALEKYDYNLERAANYLASHS